MLTYSPRKGKEEVDPVPRTGSVCRIGISIGSMIPYSLISVRMIARWAKDAGYSFLQALPLRGMTGKEILALPVFYKEHAWNPVWSLSQALKHEPGGEGMPSYINDWIASPNPDRCQQIFDTLPGREITHHFENASGRLVELCPELQMTPMEIAEKCRREGFGLVLDTEHLSRGFRENDTDNFGKQALLIHEIMINEAIDILAPFIQIVHLKDSTPDLQDMNFVRELLSVDIRPEIDFVAEFKPKLQTPKYICDFMKRFISKLANQITKSGHTIKYS